MHAKRVFLWGGTVCSAALCSLILIGGAILLMFAAEEPRLFERALTLWLVSFAGTFILSVIFLIFMLREGELGR